MLGTLYLCTRAACFECRLQESKVTHLQSRSKQIVVKVEIRIRAPQHFRWPGRQSFLVLILLRWSREITFLQHTCAHLLRYQQLIQKSGCLWHTATVAGGCYNNKSIFKFELKSLYLPSSRFKARPLIMAGSMVNTNKKKVGLHIHTWGKKTRVPPAACHICACQLSIIYSLLFSSPVAGSCF